MIHIENIVEYCSSKKGVEETFPFDQVTLVFKVMGKMFCLLPTDSEQLSINLKCNPERAISLREEYQAIIPGFHMNKKHWNTVKIDGSIPDTLIYELIDHSYHLVVQSLTKKLKSELELLNEN